MGNFWVFIILATIAIGAAVGMLTSRNAIYSALFLVLNFATIAVFYIILNAPFLAMVQIAVYAGAIMVLFMFVIMLLGVEQLRSIVDQNLWQLGFALLLAGMLIFVFLTALVMEGQGITAVAPMIDSSPAALGERLFAAYVFPFEVTGILLLTAMIGVVVLSVSKKRGNNA